MQESSKSSGNNKTEHLHHGHRVRKKEQFLKSGIAHLPEHEPLEFLLYYAIPRGDTNAIAHRLIKRFGTIAGVVNAPYEELLTVEGVGNNAASLICFAKMFSQRYLQSHAQLELKRLFNSDSLKEFCNSIFVGTMEEEFHCLYLNDNLDLLSREKVCTGKLNEVTLPLRKITRSVFETNCSRLVITHNHPAGSCIPSRVDIDSTIKIQDVYSKMEVELIDHIIVGRDGTTSMRESGYIE